MATGFALLTTFFLAGAVTFLTTFLFARTLAFAGFGLAAVFFAGVAFLTGLFTFFTIFAAGFLAGFAFEITFLTGFLSGSYPALFLSAFNPVTVLKGAVKLSTGSAWFRKGLVVFLAFSKLHL